MPQGVIDDLETVQIQINDSNFKRMAAVLGYLQQVFHLILVIPAVRKLGEIVMISQIIKFFLRFKSFCNVSELAEGSIQSFVLIVQRISIEEADKAAIVAV